MRQHLGASHIHTGYIGTLLIAADTIDSHTMYALHVEQPDNRQQRYQQQRHGHNAKHHFIHKFRHSVGYTIAAGCRQYPQSQSPEHRTGGKGRQQGIHAQDTDANTIQQPSGQTDTQTDQKDNRCRQLGIGKQHRHRYIDQAQQVAQRDINAADDLAGTNADDHTDQRRTAQQESGKGRFLKKAGIQNAVIQHQRRKQGNCRKCGPTPELL